MVIVLHMSSLKLVQCEDNLMPDGPQVKAETCVGTWSRQVFGHLLICHLDLLKYTYSYTR